MNWLIDLFIDIITISNILDGPMKIFINLRIIIASDSFLQNVFEYVWTEMHLGYIPVPVYCFKCWFVRKFLYILVS